MAVVGRFAIEYHQYVDEQGQLVADAGAAADPEALVEGYRLMVLGRAFDQKMLALQRTGQLGTFASGLGKEAVDVGMATSMRPEDVLLVTYREITAQIARRVRLTELLAYWGGDERGSDFAVPRRDWPVCITIASHCCHGVGVAYAMKLRRQSRVAVCMIGDGATSKGEFYEAINAAALWKLPIVFVVTNNQYAISVPRRMQSAAQTLAQKAIAAGMPGIQVDGNDLVAVRTVGLEALQRARSGEGPTLVEALSYRLADHTTADDASRYRDAGEVAEAWQREPIRRLRTHLLEHGLWSRQDEEALLQSCAETIDDAVANFLAMSPPPATQMFDHLHASLPVELEVQRRGAILRHDHHE